MEYTAQINHLLIGNPYQSKSTCKIFVAQPTSNELEKFGRLFALIELDYHDPQNPQIINFIIKELETSFYKNTSGKNDPEKILENALQDLNQKLRQLVKNNEVYLVLEKLNALIGLIKDKQVFFSTHGKINAFLVHPDKQKGAKLVNIIEAAGKEDGEEKTNEVFSNITSGSININDSLLFCNENLLYYISHDRIKKTLITYSPFGAVSHFKNLLEGVSANTAFAALVIKFTEHKETKRQSPIKNINLPQTSIEELLGTEEKTEKYLTPSIKPKIKEFFILIYNQSSEIARKFNKKQGKKPRVKFKQRPWYQKIILIIIGLIKKILTLIGGIIIVLYSLSLKIYKFIKKNLDEVKRDEITTPETIDNQDIVQRENKITDGTKSDLVERLGKKFSDIYKRFNKLPRSSRILLITSLIFAFLFIQSIVWLGREQDKETEIQTYNSLIEQIQNKKNEAEASIIYNDEQGAKNLLVEAEKLLEQLPKDSKKQKETYENLSSEISTQLNDLRHIVNISEPFVIADFTSIVPEGQNINNQELFKISNSLYSFNSADNSIYTVDLNSNEVIASQISSFSINLEKGNILEDGEEKFILFKRDSELARFNPNDKSLKTISITFPENSNIQDITIYNDRLYTLDTSNRQIFKHSKTSTGYNRGSAWLKENVDLSDALSITIDGNIYVLKSSGEILKFLKGGRQSFDLKNVDPELQSPTKIETKLESDYIYILEPQNKRLVVIDKDGKLKIQYHSEQFNNLKDFVVSESEKKIYLLDGSKIFGIMIEHL